MPNTSLRAALSDRGSRKMLLAVLLIAAVLRFAVLPIQGLHHPDELWQYLEPAHRLAFDRWVAAWEFRAGIRTWLIPAVLAGPMWLGGQLAPEGQLHLYFPKALLVMLSLTIVLFSAGFGLRLSRLHGLMAGFVAAIWVDLVHFAPKAMSEPFSLALFMPAAYLLTDDAERQTGRGRLVAGLLLGLCFAARFQLAPALLTLVLITCWGRLRAALPAIVLGGLLGLAIDGAIDAAAGQTPFLWIIENFRINLVENKSAHYGVAPPYWYLAVLFYIWKAAAIPILALALWGSRRYPVLLAVAIVNIAAHSLIPHKEYRFILLSTTLIVLLAAIGTGDLLRRLANGSPSLGPRAAIACLAWLGVSALVGLTNPYRGFWTAHHQLLDTLRIAGERPSVCGVGLYELKEPLSFAYTFYRRDTPVYGFKGPAARADATAAKSSFNVVISHPRRALEIDPDYRLQQCSSRLRKTPPFCVYRRVGTCTSSAPEHEINRFVAARGK